MLIYPSLKQFQAAFFLLAKFHQKINYKFEKFSDFGCFSIAKSERVERGNHQISILGFQSVAKI
jgi:hypothetical protein